MIQVYLNQEAIDALCAQSVAEGHIPTFKNAGLYPLGEDVLEVLMESRQENEKLSDVVVRLIHAG